MSIAVRKKSTLEKNVDDVVSGYREAEKTLFAGRRLALERLDRLVCGMVPDLDAGMVHRIREVADKAWQGYRQEKKKEDQAELKRLQKREEEAAKAVRGAR